MSYLPIYHRFLKKDIERDKTSGKHTKEDFELLKSVISMLCVGEMLPARYLAHPLSGEWEGSFECHIASDWLLIYTVEEVVQQITFLRLGTHSQLFKKFK